MRELWTIFASFFRVGLLTFGGGYSIIPMLEKEAINKYNWLTKEELLDFFAVSQCIPGVIATNMAVMVGNKVRKLSGAIAAAIGVVMPSLIIIMIIAAFLQNFANLEIVQNAFWGIRVVVAALIFGVVLNMFKTGIIDKLTFVIFVVLPGAPHTASPKTCAQAARALRTPAAHKGRFPQNPSRQATFLSGFSVLDYTTLRQKKQTPAPVDRTNFSISDFFK